MERLVIEILFQAGSDRELGRVLIGGELRADNNIEGTGSVPNNLWESGAGKNVGVLRALVRKPALGRIIERGEVASRA